MLVVACANVTSDGGLLLLFIFLIFFLSESAGVKVARRANVRPLTSDGPEGVAAKCQVSRQFEE